MLLLVLYHHLSSIVSVMVCVIGSWLVRVQVYTKIWKGVCRQRVMKRETHVSSMTVCEMCSLPQLSDPLFTFTRWLSIEKVLYAY